MARRDHCKPSPIQTTIDGPFDSSPVPLDTVLQGVWEARAGYTKRIILVIKSVS